MKGESLIASAPQSKEGVPAGPSKAPWPGSCFGYEVRSALPFHFLREGRGEPLEVVESDLALENPPEPLLEWTQIGGQPFLARLYERDGRYSLWIDGMGWYHIDPSVPSVTVPPFANSVLREQRMWGYPAVLCFVERGDLPIHASAVDVNGSALLLAAPGHFGKTTLAAAFLQAGYRVLAEDTSCCRLSPAPAVFPGPATLRIRRDAYERLELPGAYTVVEEPHRVHLAIADGLRGDGLPVPIAGIIFLHQTDGGLTIERVEATASLPDVWALTFKLPVEASLARSFQGAVDLASKVPVWNLYRPLQFADLPQVVDRIVSTCL